MIPLVSIIVPSFNHASFLSKRIDSVFSQTFKKIEVILLDDCSTDNSWEYLKSFNSNQKVSHCIRNESNSGSPFKQWKKGIEMAKGEIIWIAESDDWAEKNFLEETVQFLVSNQLELVITGSHYVDIENRIIGEVIHDYDGGIFDGNRFCENFMYSRNGILNASAVIFSKANIQQAMLDSIPDFRLSGDHFFWVQLMKDQKIGVLDQKLNYFRWHSSAVRAVESGNLTELLEGIRIKTWMEANLRIGYQQKFEVRRNAYRTYFKFLTCSENPKKLTEFFKLWAFFNPADKFKSLIRYFLV